MKLNHDCVRDLLLSIEEEIPVGQFLNSGRLQQLPRMNKYSIDDVNYTIIRLEEAGYIKANILQSLEVTEAIVTSLTYSGHLFLDNLRDDGIWKKTKQSASKVAGTSLTVMAGLAESYVKEKLGLS